jgi:hypothetical protein
MRGDDREPAQACAAADEPPVQVARTARRQLEDDERDDVGDQDADGHPLLQHAEHAAAVARGVLGDVGSGNSGVGPDGQPNEGARGEQHGGVRVTADRIAPTA